jgi:hypothetical protein
MKQISILILYFLCSISINAQDTINLKNRKVIHAYIIEKSKTEIKYKLDTISAYTTFITKLSKIKSIHYSKLNYALSDIPKVPKPREKYALGINGGLGMFGVTGFFSGSVDYFIKPYLSTELTIGGYSGAFYTLGGKYWLANKDGINGYSPFVGLLYGGFFYTNFLEIPLGISHTSKSGFQTSIQLSYVNFWYDMYRKNLKLEFRVGWRFK